MTPMSFKFQCVHCDQRIECDIDLAGREIDCPRCQRPLIIPQTPAIDVTSKAESSVAPTYAVRPRDWFSQIVLGAMLGALAGSLISLLRSPPMVLGGDELWQGRSNIVIEWIHAIAYRTVLSFWGFLGAIMGGVWAHHRFLKRCKCQYFPSTDCALSSR